ncbi:MAG: carboxypeptidase-like regulatory domain-containing protein, partial [Duncaniella sp.]|nr:carboxypeptidase-like regulatory domain-containing protein [Duncaniella sp.]
MQRTRNPFLAMATIMRISLCITVLLLSGGVIPAHALSASDIVEAKGTVSDEQGEALPGVTVTQVGSSSNVVVTDLDGLYTIKVPKGSVVEFTYIGKNPAQVTVSASKTY